jgi:hypothetical protein
MVADKSVFPNDATSWAVGVIVGVVVAALILGIIALCLRRKLCPPNADDTSPQVVTSQPNEDRENNVLEVESTGSQDRVRPHVGAFAPEGTEKDPQLHSDPEADEGADGVAPHTGMRAIAMVASVGRRKSQSNVRTWRY